MRVAFFGDSTTYGMGSVMPFDELAFIPFERGSIDQTDGSQYGLKGWPYLLNQKRKEHNKTVDYTFMMHAFPGGNLLRPGVYRYYKDNCRYEQFLKSMPHFAFITLGGMDQCIKSFTEDAFINSYVQLVKEA